MKRRVLLLLAAAVALFAVVGVLKSLHQDDGETSDRAPAREAERQRVTRFWRFYQDATSARMQGDFASATELYRKALALKPDHEDSIYYLGNCFFETGDYRRAAEQYRKITRMNPRSQRAFSQLGVTLSTLDPAAPFDPAEAEASFRRSIAINSEESGPFVRLGLLALRSGDPTSALGHFRTAAGFRSPEAYFQAGSILFSQGDYREAGAMFREVLRMNAREKAISGRGVLSEGDIQTSRKALTPVEAAGVKALLYLGWTDDRLRSETPNTDQAFRIHLDDPATGGNALTRVSAFDHLMAKATHMAWADFDRDGDQDLALAVPGGKIELYSNEDGRLLQGRSGLSSGGRQGVASIAWGDYDGDGWPDLFVSGGDLVEPGSAFLYRNTGRGFTDVTPSTGLSGKRITLRQWVGDLDLDGKPDLLEAGCSDGVVPSVRFYRNLGANSFRDTSRRAGLIVDGSATDCLVADFNSDRLPDVVVLRWKLPPLLFLAVKPGQFATPLMPEKKPLDGYSCLAADFNRDSHLDLLLTAHAPYELAAQNLIDPDLDLPVETPHLLLGDGRGGFRDATTEMALGHCFGIMQAGVIDVDHDGWPDLVLANGGFEPNRLEPSIVLRNESGKKFQRLAYLPDIKHPGQARSLTICDSDGDRLPEIWLAGIGVFEVTPSSYRALLTEPRTH